MEKLNLKLLSKLGACDEAVKVYIQWKESDISVIFDTLLDGSEAFAIAVETASELNVSEIVVDEATRLEWANWLISRLLCKEDKIRYAIFAAEQVVEIFENQYPEDKRPREAIEAARTYLNGEATARAADAADAARAARAAADAARAADAADAARAARAAAYAARAAAYAVDAAAYAARAAAYAARAAAYAADAAADACSYNQMLVKILLYGIELLTKAG